jgi:hypothetical protein
VQHVSQTSSYHRGRRGLAASIRSAGRRCGIHGLDGPHMRLRGSPSSMGHRNYIPHPHPIETTFPLPILSKFIKVSGVYTPYPSKYGWPSLRVFRSDLPLATHHRRTFPRFYPPYPPKYGGAV